MPACLSAAAAAGLTTTSVLLPMIVALARTYLVVAGVLELAPLVAAVLLLELPLPLPPLELPLLLELPPPFEVPLPLEVLLLEVVLRLLEPPPLEPLPQAATTSPAATITAIAGCRERLRSKPISFLPRLVEANGDTLRSPAPCAWR